MKRRATLFILLAFSMVGCGGSQVLNDVSAVLDGIAALQSALPSAGVSPALAKEIGDYATAAATGTAQCAAVLATGGETATLVAKCGQDLAAAVQPTLPAGTPQNVAGLVATVYAEIQVVYAAIEAGSTGTTGTTGTTGSTTGVAKAAATIRSSSTWHPSSRDAGKLKALAVRANKLAKT